MSFGMGYREPKRDHARTGQDHRGDKAVARARAIVRRPVPAGLSLADELIAERRSEAKRE